MALPTHGQAGIIVNNADTVRQEGVSVDTGLTNVTRSVGPRIVLQYANTKREERIIAPPADLRTLFAQVPVRIALQYANTKREERITAPPTDLRTLFAQVPARIVLQHANTMRQAALTAPPGEPAHPLRPGRQPHHPAVRQHQPTGDAGLSRCADRRHRAAADQQRRRDARGRQHPRHLEHQ
ncbi:MAG: hypothetical protein IPM84_23080 [Anaerolineae bacterium]|nr:hypothetical protein [Anaerolineae bacterium]